jgi:hypothetical protein
VSASAEAEAQLPFDRCHDLRAAAIDREFDQVMANLRFESRTGERGQGRLNPISQVPRHAFNHPA